MSLTLQPLVDSIAAKQYPEPSRPSTPCGHNVPLQLEPQGAVLANYCPMCRAVEQERERCAKVAVEVAYDSWHDANDTAVAETTADRIAARIRSGK